MNNSPCRSPRPNATTPPLHSTPQVHVKTPTEKSLSVLTMTASASSIDDTSLLGSPAAEAGGSTTSSAHSHSTPASEVATHAYKGGTVYERSGSVASAAASAAAAMSLSSGESGVGSSGGEGTWSIRTFSLPMSEGLSRAPSQSESDLGHRGNSSSSTGGDSAGGMFDSDHDSEKGYIVDHDTLMAALRKVGIITGEAEDEWRSLSSGDLQYSSRPSNIQQPAQESFPQGSERAALSTISMGGNGYDYEDDQVELDPGSMIASSTGSMPGLMNFEDIESADERTDRLFDMFRNEPVLATALQGMQLVRTCNLDLSTANSNDDLVREGVIGAGHYGQVSVVEHEFLGVKMAMKELADVSTRYKVRLSSVKQLSVC